MKLTVLFILGLLCGLTYYSLKQENYLMKVQECVKEKSTEHACLRQLLPKAVKRIGAAATLEILQTMETKQEYNCHIAAHLVGESSLNNPSGMMSSLKMCGNSCQYGCTHGVMAKVFRENGGADVAQIGSLCEQNTHDVSRLDQTACFHGIGHGVAEYAAYDLKRSLELCAQLDIEVRRRECATGVFMEIYDINLDRRILPEIKPELCDEAPASMQEMCRTTVMNRDFVRSKDPGKAIEACQKLPNEAKNKCFSALGGETVFVLEKNIEDIWSVCNTSNEGLSPSECIKGVMYSAFVVDKLGDYPIQICSHDEMRISQRACFDILRQKLVQISSPYLGDICDRLKKEYQYDCQI